MILILTGAPGAGKGTQGELLSNRLGFEKMSTGDALRGEIKAETPIGLEAKAYIDAGKLVPDDTMRGILESSLGRLDGKRVILDGYPRNLAQADTLKSLEERFPLDAVVHLKVPESVLIDRLTGRRVCDDCGATFHLSMNPPKENGVCDRCGHTALIQRSDDGIDKVKVRLNVYEEQTEPILDYYRDRGLYHQVEGGGSSEDVYERLQGIVQDLGLDGKTA